MTPVSQEVKAGGVEDSGVEDSKCMGLEVKDPSILAGARFAQVLPREHHRALPLVLSGSWLPKLRRDDR